MNSQGPNTDQKAAELGKPDPDCGRPGLGVRLFFKILRVVVGVPLVLLFTIGVLGLMYCVTWQGACIGAFSVLIALAAFVSDGHWNRPWFARNRKRILGLVLISSTFLLGIPTVFSPVGNSRNGRVRNEYLDGPSKYSRLAIWNVIPEEDQVSVIIAIAGMFDPHLNSAKTKRLRSLTLPYYRQMKTDDEFNSLGSAMGMAYRELLQLDFRNGHSFSFVPESENETKIPCLVFLHGMGGNRKSHFQVMTRVASQLNCVVIAPTFGLGNWDQAAAGQDVVAIIRKAIQQHPIDPNEIFLMGYSNGAKGVAHAIAEDPELFKGLIFLSPVTEDQFFTSTEYRKKQEIRRVLFLHGDQDSRIPLDSVNDTAELLKRMGGDVRVKVYPNEDHYLLLSQPDTIAKEIAGFMKGQ